MSLSVTTDVHCDDCGQWCEGVTGTQPDPGEARKKAKANGWVYRARYGVRGTFRRVDLCKECAAKPETTP